MRGRSFGSALFFVVDEFWDLNFRASKLIFASILFECMSCLVEKEARLLGTERDDVGASAPLVTGQIPTCLIENTTITNNIKMNSSP